MLKHLSEAIENTSQQTQMRIYRTMSNNMSVIFADLASIVGCDVGMELMTLMAFPEEDLPENLRQILEKVKSQLKG